MVQEDMLFGISIGCQVYGNGAATSEACKLARHDVRSTGLVSSRLPIVKLDYHPLRRVSWAQFCSVYEVEDRLRLI